MRASASDDTTGSPVVAPPARALPSAAKIDAIASARVMTTPIAKERVVVRGMNERVFVDPFCSKRSVHNLDVHDLPSC